MTGVALRQTLSFLVGAVLGLVLPVVLFRALYPVQELPPIQCIPPSSEVHVGGPGARACGAYHGLVRRYENGQLQREEMYECGRLINGNVR